MPEPFEVTVDQSRGATALEIAERILDSRGAKLTSIRRFVLSILSLADKPLGAYQILELLGRSNGRSVSPSTVYRALEFLLAQRLISRIESHNAFVLCRHPDRAHVCVFLLCESCGSIAEVENSQIDRILAHEAGALGFRLDRRIVEMRGTCASCTNSVVHRC
jgi:Fur family zinc uptake transcriptional regulator